MPGHWPLSPQNWKPEQPTAPLFLGQLIKFYRFSKTMIDAAISNFPSSCSMDNLPHTINYFIPSWVSVFDRSSKMLKTGEEFIYQDFMFVMFIHNSLLFSWAPESSHKSIQMQKKYPACYPSENFKSFFFSVVIYINKNPLTRNLFRAIERSR